MSPHIVTITGAPVPSGMSACQPIRLEINELINELANRRQWYLYVQAVAALQAKDQNDPLSHFQIAGIHGMPYTAWDGSVGPEPVPGVDIPDKWSGYCTHGTVLFPTWHRPYVALWEQALQAAAASIAATYTTDDKAEWIAAASTLRTPYWDWVHNSVPPPEVISTAALQIITPTSNGQLSPFVNPLLAYAFHPLDPSFEAINPCSKWPSTLRHPTTNGPDAVTSTESLISAMQLISPQLVVSTGMLFTLANDWIEMSNHSQKLNPKYAKTSSLEGIHDLVHLNIGGVAPNSLPRAGHMGHTEYAAFDPIFMLHHAHVDYLFAMWQALHTDKWVTPSESVDGTYTQNRSVPVDTMTNLTPFWNGETTYWRSDDVKSCSAFGYGYKFGASNDPEVTRKEVLNLVRERYLGVAAGTPGSYVDEARSTQTIEWPNWTVRVRSKKHELGGSYTVVLFLGAVPDDPSEWVISPSYAGAHAVFTGSNHGRCSNCVAQSHFVVENYIHINHVLLSGCRLESVEPKAVLSYLERNLHWRVQGAGRQIVPVEELKSLVVEVFQLPFGFDPRRDSLPRMIGEAKAYPEVTAARLGGSRHVKQSSRPEKLERSFDIVKSSPPLTDDEVRAIDEGGLMHGAASTRCWRDCLLWIGLLVLAIGVSGLGWAMVTRQYGTGFLKDTLAIVTCMGAVLVIIDTINLRSS